MLMKIMKISQAEICNSDFLKPYSSKGYGARRLLRGFSYKGWKHLAVNKLLVKIRQMGKVDRQIGSGRPRSARTDENIEKVEDLVLSQ